MRMLVCALTTLMACGNGDGAATRGIAADAGAEDSATPVRGGSLEGAPASASADGDAIWRTTSGGYDILWSAEDITASRAGNPPFLSVGGGLDSAIGSVSVPVAPDDTSGWICEDEHDLRVLSAVGPILSLEWKHYSYCAGAAHPNLNTSYVAIDLARSEREGVYQVDGRELIGREISLTDVFPDGEVLAALISDRLVQKRIEEIRIKTIRPRTTAELVSMLEGGAECEYGFETDMLRRFSFDHVEGDRVAVRIGLSHGCEAARGRLTQIGIMLKVPESMREDFAAASDGTRGILMRDAMKRFPTSVTHVGHRYRLDDAASDTGPNGGAE